MTTLSLPQCTRVVCRILLRNKGYNADGRISEMENAGALEAGVEEDYGSVKTLQDALACEDSVRMGTIHSLFQHCFQRPRPFVAKQCAQD